VASNPSTPSSVLERLYNEADARTSLAANPSVPLTVLRKLAADSDEMVRQNLLYNPNLPNEMLEELAKDRTLGPAASAALRARSESRHWLIVRPPYEWAWLQRCTAVYDDDAPIDQWPPAGYRFGTQDECERLLAEVVRRERSPGRSERLRTWTKRCESRSPPLDPYSHARCAYRAG
jgi:hypothetical protein